MFRGSQMLGTLKRVAPVSNRGQDGLAVCGIVEKEHTLVCQRFIKFLDKISLVAKRKKRWHLRSHQPGPGG
jgi:hypothetical protein